MRRGAFLSGSGRVGWGRVGWGGVGSGGVGSGRVGSGGVGWGGVGGVGGGLFNLEKTMVLVLHKELEYKVEKLKYKKVGGHEAKDQNQI